jgi:hypothetical protein
MAHAQAFAAQHGISRVHDSWALLADPDLDADGATAATSPAWP